MKKIGFIADFYSNQILGGAESNDSNLISFLSKNNDIKCFQSKIITFDDIESCDSFIIGNFISLSENKKKFLIKTGKEYIIYEHDHKYVSNRDPSKYFNFLVPKQKLINIEFYRNAKCVVVLSKICKHVLESNLNKIVVHNIGCSLWSSETFDFFKSNCENQKKKNICIMKSPNPTKNYSNTVKYCENKGLSFESISDKKHINFLEKMSYFKTFLFIPTVLETYSRVCAEAKMLNLKIMTNRKMIGFFSEENSSLNGIDLIKSLEEKNNEAFKFFGEII